MEKADTIIAVFTDHETAETAIRKLTVAGFERDHLSIIGKGYHTEEKVIGFYSLGDRIRFWGTRGAFWGGLWGLFFGGLFITLPVTGPVVGLGYLAAVVVTAIEGAVMSDGLSALGAALLSLGVPEGSVIEYESVLKADGFLVMARGTPDEITRAGTILSAVNPSLVDIHATPPMTLTVSVGH